MRTQQEIRESADGAENYDHLMLEVLLDIRELLSQRNAIPTASAIASEMNRIKNL